MSPSHRRTLTVWGLGSYPMGMIPRLLDAGRQLGMLDQILAIGVAEYNRATFRPLTDGQDGIVDISPALDEIKNAAGFVGDRAIAERNRSNWEGSNHSMVDRFIAMTQELGLADGESFWFQGQSSGHTRLAEESLEDVQTRHPHFVTAISIVPEEANLREAIRHDPHLFSRFKDRGLVETTILPDAHSPLARRFGLAHQDQCMALALASLKAAQVHFPRQRGLADIVHALGQYSAYTGVAVAARNVVVTREVRGWHTLRRPFGWPPRGFVSLDDVLTACRQAVHATLTDPLTQTIAEPIDERKLAVLTLTVPFKLSDSRWTTLAATLKDELIRTHPTVTVVFAAGNGVPDPRYHSPYWVQASLFYPLPEPPTVIQEIMAATPMVRRVGPPAPNGNGHHAEDLHALPIVPVATELGGAA